MGRGSRPDYQNGGGYERRGYGYGGPRNEFRGGPNNEDKERCIREGRCYLCYQRGHKASDCSTAQKANGVNYREDRPTIRRGSFRDDRPPRRPDGNGFSNNY
jgi:hypothetical protein